MGGLHVILAYRHHARLIKVLYSTDQPAMTLRSLVHAVR